MVVLSLTCSMTTMMPDGRGRRRLSAPSGRAALQVHQQQRYRRGRDAADARGLADRRRQRALQLQQYLRGEAAYAVVIETLRDGRGFVTALALDLLALALQVTGILGLHFHLGRHFRVI